MHDKGKIIAGLVIFVILAIFPVFYNSDKSSAVPKPDLDTPLIQQLEEQKCVESKSFMRAQHMQLLDDWRDAVVRGGDRIYVNAEGKKFNMSLQNTCLNCHSNKEQFCDRCHTYTNVKPYCWDCHLSSKENLT